MNNKAVIEFGFHRIEIIEFSFRRIWSILQNSQPSASVDNTLLDLQNSSYPTQPHLLIAKYPCRTVEN